MQTYSLYIRVAEFTIELNFKKNKESIIKNFISSLYYFLTNYICQKPKSNKVLCRINIFNKIQEPNYYKNNNLYYILFANKISAFEINTTYNIGIPQLIVLIQIIIEEIISITKGSFFLHASGVRIKNNAYLFLGKNTAGKSTIVELLSGGKISPFCDDITIVRKRNDKYYCYSTTLFENKIYKKNHNPNDRLKIKRIFLIFKGDIFKLERIQFNENKSFLTNFLRNQIKYVFNDLKMKDMKDFINQNKNNFFILIFPKKKFSYKQKKKIFS